MKRLLLVLAFQFSGLFAVAQVRDDFSATYVFSEEPLNSEANRDD
jgi:hypothetical protein